MSILVEIITDDEAVKSYDYPIEVKIYSGGTQIVPSAATITVKSPSGTVQVEDVAMAISAGGILTYTLDSDYTGILWENAVIEIEYTVSSVTYKAVFMFDVVLNKLKCSVIDANLKDFYPQLADELWTEQSNYDDQIQEAFKQIKRDIKNKGKRTCMLIDGMQIRELIIHKAFEIIFFSMIKEEGDKWDIRHIKEQEVYKDQLEKILIFYDKDESGLIDAEESEKRQAVSQIEFKR